MKKKLKLFLLMLLALMTSLPNVVMADDDDPDEPNTIPILPYPHIKIPRPRARSINMEVYPECSYYNGAVTISAEPDITSITAEVEDLDNGQIWTGFDSSNILTIEVSSEPGTYSLLLTLSNGKSYYGEYSIQ